jgi:hypothetical protein
VLSEQLSLPEQLSWQAWSAGQAIVVFLQLLLEVQAMMQSPLLQPPVQTAGQLPAPGGGGSSPQLAPPLELLAPPCPAWPPLPDALVDAVDALDASN